MRADCFAFVAVLAVLCSAAAPARAFEPPAPADDGAAAPASDDYLLPGPGHLATSAATGVPYVAIAELAVGIGDAFAIGAVAGLTPRVEAIGLRPRVAIPLGEATRVFVIAPMFYYPSTNDLGREPWVLAYPSLRAERDFGAARLHGGVGLVAAACADDLAHRLGLSSTHPDDHAFDTDPGFMGGAWNTFLVGGAVPLGDGHALFADASIVLSGLELAEWVGGPPVVITLGTTWNL